MECPAGQWESPCLLSQAVSLLKTLISGNLPAVNVWILVGMIACGVLGSGIGGRINKRLSDRYVTRLFEGAMILVLCISVYNMIRFLQ